MGGRPPEAAPGWARLVLVAGVLAALLPIATATARAVITLDWFPVGDNGFVYARTTDVFSADTPLLYMWSTGSNWAAEPFNNPGPSFYWLLAGPTALLGPKGAAVATALLNAGAVLGIAFVARRRGGDVLAVAAVLVAALLAHSMGSELLYDPWPPNSLLLPCLLYLLLAWSAVDGDLPAIPAMAAVGTLLLQTNLSFALLVPGLAAVAVGAVAVHLRRQRRRDPGTWPDRRREARRLGVVTVAVLAVLWTPSVVEQLTSEGTGNLTRIARAMQDVPYTLGPAGAVRLVGGVTALPEWWFRGSMTALYGDPPSTAMAVGGAVVVALVLAGLGWVSLRCRDRVSVAGLVTAGCALAVSFVTVARSPVTIFGELSPYRTRFIWAVAAMTTLAVAAAVLRRLVSGRRAADVTVVLLAAGTAAVAIANVPHFQQFGGHEPPHTIPAVNDLRGQLDGLDEEGTIFVDWAQDSSAHQYFLSGVLAELARRDIPFRVEANHLVRTFGPRQELTGDNADVRLVVRTGERAFDREPGEERVAFHEGLTGGERSELRRIRADLARDVDEDRLRLTPEGAAALERLAGFLQLDEAGGRRFARYVELEGRSDERTAGVFLGPLDER